jgi:hypothetical protein
MLHAKLESKKYTTDKLRQAYSCEKGEGYVIAK